MAGLGWTTTRAEHTDEAKGLRVIVERSPLTGEWGYEIKSMGCGVGAKSSPKWGEHEAKAAASRAVELRERLRRMP